jgi:hypothetical protein
MMNKLFFSVFFLATAAFTTAQTTHTPVIMVHGMLASGDTWTNFHRYFFEQGYSQEELWVLDWNTASFNSPKAVSQLDSLIGVVKKVTGSKKVNLIGHSAGGGVCMTLVNDKKMGKSVERYVHLASMPVTEKPAVPTLNIYSPADKITGGKDYAGVDNKVISNQDHYEVATSRESFSAVYGFFNQGKTPKEVPSGIPTTVQLSGKACTMGDNTPESGATIEIYAFNPKTGERLSTEPMARFVTGSDGRWGPMAASSTQHYEFVVKPQGEGKRVVHYFREPHTFHNSTIYLRTLPTGGLAGFLLKSLPLNEKEVCLAVFSSSKAMLHGRDNLAVQGLEITRSDIASESKTAIAFFVFDEKSDGQSTGMAISAFKNLPFMAAVDFLIDPEFAPIDVNLNGRRMMIPGIRANEGIVVVVYE